MSTSIYHFQLHQNIYAKMLRWYKNLKGRAFFCSNYALIRTPYLQAGDS